VRAGDADHGVVDTVAFAAEVLQALPSGVADSGTHLPPQGGTPRGLRLRGQRPGKRKAHRVSSHVEQRTW
jgi:hypothetical protein